jgi:hypothetical protein
VRKRRVAPTRETRDRRTDEAIHAPLYVRRRDAERFIEEIRGGEPELAKHCASSEREVRGRRAELATGSSLASGCGLPLDLPLLGGSFDDS